MSSIEPNQSRRSRSARYGECAIWLAIVAGMWGYSYAFDAKLSTYALGPVAWPRAILVLIAVAAIGALIADHMRTENAASPVGADVDTGPLDGAARMRLAAAIVLPLIYVWLLPRAGYFASTPVFLALYMYVLGITNWRTILATTVVASAALLLLFSKLLYIPLPTGNWPGFYDFSNWLLVMLR